MDELTFEKSAQPELNENNLNACYQDAHGYLWLGTNKGLWKYDSYKLNKFTLGNTELSHNSVKDIREDRFGNIYVSANGLHVIGANDNQLHHIAFQKDFNNGFYTAWTGKMAIRNDELWLGTWQHIVRFSILEKRIVGTYFNKGNGINEANNHPYCDAYNRIWNCSTLGVFLFNEQLQKFDKIKGIDGNVFAVCALRNKEILACAYDGLYSIDLSHLSAKKIVASETPLQSGCLNEVYCNKRFQVLVSMGKSGLSRWNPSTQQLQECLPLSLKSHNGEWANCIYQAGMDKPIFISTTKGLELIPPLPYSISRCIPSKKDALICRGFYKTASDKLIIATQKGLYEKTATQNTLSSIRGFEGDINALVPIQERLLLCTTKGIYSCNPLHLEQRPRLILSGNIKTCISYNNELWCINSDGLLELYSNEGKNLNERMNASVKAAMVEGRKFTCFAIDQQQRLWLGAVGGFFVYDAIKGTLSNWSQRDPKHDLESIAVNSMYCANNGNMWLATWGEVWEIDSKGIIVSYLNADRFEDIHIQNVTGTEDGIIWLSNGDGVYCLDVATGELSLFNSSSGLGENECFEGFALIDNHLFIGHSNGFSDIDLKSKIAERPIIPRLTGIYIQGKALNVFPEKLILAHDEDVVTFTFSGFEFNAEPLLQYEYRLEGFDEDWVKTIGTPQCSYSNLLPGTYELMIRGAWHSSIKNAPFTRLSLVVLPAFYQTYWFWLLVLCAVILIVLSIQRYRKKQREKIQGIRNRIARDLHDDMGSTISSINIYGKLLQKGMNDPKIIKQMNENMDTLNDTLKEIIWNVSPSKDQVTELIDYLKNYCFSLTETTGINFQIEADVLSYIKLRPENRRNILLIVKEFINNAIKYSECSLISIQIELKGRRLFVQLSDNGKGFDIGSVKKGNGLTNMENRCIELNANYHFESHKESGTRLVFNMAVN